MNLGEAKALVGSIGFPSKMPGTSYALPASACVAGAALAKIKGSICSVCYALCGNAKYQMPRAAIGQAKRLAAIAGPRWVEAMVRLLRHLHSGPIRVDLGKPLSRRAQPGWPTRQEGESRTRWNQPGFHRWHDSGDLQSVEHLEQIIEVCRQTPHIRHWLPTRELAMLRACKASIPDNLTIRVSATMLDGLPPSGCLGSAVHTDTAPAGAHVCPAPQQGHMCGACRACWDRDVPLVSYRRH